MKYLVILYDGMSDYPVPGLNNKTPMMVAKKPNFDSLGRQGEIGLVKTVPDDCSPASDIANLSVLGYDVSKNYTGRSPLEAVSIGVDLKETDVTLRCNLVTLSKDGPYDQKTMVDYSAGDISSEDAAEIIKTVQEHFGNDIFKFYNGVSYRHCLVWQNGTTDLGHMTPPHDISGRTITDYLSGHENAKDLIRMMRESYDLLKDHPINLKRRAKGKLPANSIWLWGEGTRPNLESFYSKYSLKGSMISAVDLLKGIGKVVGMKVPHVEGATGYIDTNFKGKAEAAVKEFEDGQDFVYIHIEAPDECGHRREIENKVRSIELIDEEVLPIVIEALEKYDDYKIMILPDHPTPIVTATHARDPVPYMIFHKMMPCDMHSGITSVSEESAAASGKYFDSADKLMDYFLKG